MFGLDRGFVPATLGGMERETAILLTLVAYKLVLLGLGLVGRSRTSDARDFYLGGQRLGPVVAAVSAAASSSSAWTLLGVSGAAYAWGLSAVWIFPACVGGFALNWYVLGPGLHRLAHRDHSLTVGDVLAGEPGRPHADLIRRISAVIILASLGTYVCSQMQAAGKTFESTFGLGAAESIAIGAGIVVLYTLLGGFWAVSLTDTLQGLLMAVTSIVLPWAAVIEVGGPAALLESLQGLDIPGFADPFGDRTLPLAAGFIAGLLGIGLGYPGQPHVVNRLMALRDDAGRALVVGRRVAMAWAVVVYAGMLVLGWCGRVLAPALGDNETVFIAATNLLFPPVVAGVMLAAVLSAVMSTADSQLLVAGSAVTHDLGWKGATPAATLRRARLVVLALSAVAAVGAATTDASIFDRVLFAWGAMGAAFGPLLLWTACRGAVPPGRTVVAMLLGASVSVAAFFVFTDADDKWIERVVPFALVLGVIALGWRQPAPASSSSADHQSP